MRTPSCRSTSKVAASLAQGSQNHETSTHNTRHTSDAKTLQRAALDSRARGHKTSRLSCVASSWSSRVFPHAQHQRHHGCGQASSPSHRCGHCRTRVQFCTSWKASDTWNSSAEYIPYNNEVWDGACHRGIQVGQSYSLGHWVCAFEADWPKVSGKERHLNIFRHTVVCVLR